MSVVQLEEKRKILKYILKLMQKIKLQIKILKIKQII